MCGSLLSTHEGHHRQIHARDGIAGACARRRGGLGQVRPAGLRATHRRRADRARSALRALALGKPWGQGRAELATTRSPRPAGRRQYKSNLITLHNQSPGTSATWRGPKVVAQHGAARV